MYQSLIRFIAGPESSHYTCGVDKIRTLRHALLWRIADLRWLDARIDDDGRVVIWRAS